MSRAFVLALGIAITLSSMAGAQAPLLPAGSKIRIAAPALFPGDAVGVVERVTADTIRFASPGLGSVAVPVSGVTRLQVSRGEHRSPFTAAAPIWAVPGGALIGMVAGLPFTALMAATGDKGEETMAWSAGIGATLGLATGLVIRAASKSETWEWVPLAHDATSVTASAPTPTSSLTQQRVRVRVNDRLSHRVEGYVAGYQGDTMVISSNARLTAVDLRRVSEFEVYRGKSRASGARAGLMWGAAAGAGLSVVSAARPNSENDLRDTDCIDTMDECERASDLEQALSMTAGSAILGAGIGALIGRDRWERMGVPQHGSSAPGLSIHPSTRGVTLVVSASF